RASGTMDYLVNGFSSLIAFMGLDAGFVDALPVAFMKPLSGSGARGLMVELMAAKGADDFAARVACVILGSAETTWYVLAVYFGSVAIKKTRHSLPCALIADLVGVIAAIIVAYIFFGYLAIFNYLELLYQVTNYILMKRTISLIGHDGKKADKIASV